MSNVDLLTQEVVEITFSQPPYVRRVAAHRFGDFAVHKCHDRKTQWRVSHLPTGRCIALGFKAFEGAVDTMVDVARLRNDWAVIDDGSVTIDLRDKCDAIARKNGGRCEGQDDNFPRLPEFNGYTPDMR